MARGNSVILTFYSLECRDYVISIVYLLSMAQKNSEEYQKNWEIILEME